MPEKTWKNKLRNFLTPAMARKSGVVNGTAKYYRRDRPVEGHKEANVSKDVIEAAREFQTKPTRDLYRWLFSKGKPGFDFVEAVETLENKRTSKEEQEAIVTSLIILRLILSGDLIVKVRGFLGRREEAIERSWSRLTTFEAVVRSLGYILPAATFAAGTSWLADPDYAEQLFNQIEITAKTDEYLSTVGTQFLSARYGSGGSGDYLANMLKDRNDQAAFDEFTSKVIAKADEIGGPPSQEDIKTIIADINLRFPLQAGGRFSGVSRAAYSLWSSGPSNSHYTSMATLVKSSLKKLMPQFGPYQVGQILGFTGSISVSTISEMAHGTLTHGIIAGYRALFKAVTRHYNYKNKQEMIKLIDTFLIEFEVAREIILSRKFRDSIDLETTLGATISSYVDALLEQINIRTDETRPNWLEFPEIEDRKRFTPKSLFKKTNENENSNRELYLSVLKHKLQVNNLNHINKFSTNTAYGTNLAKANNENRKNRTEKMFNSKTMNRSGRDLRNYNRERNERAKMGFFGRLIGTRKTKMSS
uniref:Uncharacterized protein n=1 Tax=viral metagenome TaxID=1070528 RepID=A0A6C0BCU6_9ZZZZ